MKIIQGLWLLQVQKCAVCLQLPNHEIEEEEQWHVLLFGAEPYMVCCACKRIVPPKLQSKRYVKRYNKFLKEKD